MERDDIIEYSLDAHHSEEEGRKIRRTIWMVTLLLAVVTAVEVALGAYWKEWFPGAWHLVKAVPGHYLKGEEGAHHIEGEAAMTLWNDRVEYIDGANMTRNEYGPPQYANFFFFITGFHGFHVFSGVVINFIVLLMVMKGVFHRRGHYEMVEKAGLYWHFVDLVWVFVFTFFYLV